MKANMKLNRLLSLLLALVMVVGLLPAMGQVAYAYSEGDIAGTTGSGASKEDPVVCDTFAEFKAAMENTEITYVKLTGASGAMPSRETLGAAISNTTYKVLTIEGTNKFWSPLNGNNDCLIWPRNELTINGTGTLKYEHGNTGGTGAVINMASNVSLKIDGNVTLEGGANGSSFGYAIFAQAGTTKINGGSFIGYSADITSNADVSAVIINSSANLTINGGNFSASLHQNSPEGKKAHSLSITSTATGAISIKEGTFPQGINIKARGKTIENCGYFDTAKASITADGNAVATTASTNVLNGKNVVVTDTSIIASVAVAVTEPVAGAQPQNGVSNTDNVTVTITEWYHNGVKMLATDTFAAGETYKVHVIVKPNSGYEFADNPTATFNGSTAGTIYMYGKDYINYYAEFTATTEPIGSVDVTITKPVAGAQPQNGVSNTDNVTVTITEWYHNGVKMLATDTFAAGETYKVHVIVKPNSGYEFADNPTATFNGSTAGTIYMYGKDYINYYAEFTVPAASTPTTIDTVAISVTAPTAGAAPVVEPAGLPTGVTCEPVLTTVTGWYDSETNTKMASTEKFVEGKTYYICLFLSADTGYSFANPITTATINGDNATIELNNDGYLAIKKSFVASASATTIDTIAVTVTVPVAGAAPVVEPAGLPTGVTCEPVLTTVTGWYDSETNTKMASTEKFVEGKTYYICLFLSADTGYSFANPITTATINGDNATIELNNDGYLAIKKSFVATAAATTEYDITVTDGKATIGAGTEISKAAEGTTVTLTANAAPSGQVFDKWVVVSGSITLADANSATTTFTMPASAVSVKATYKDAPHTHTFDQEIIKDAALKTAADCTHDAVYYKSCSCGAISTDDADTFTAINSALGHAWPEEGSWSKDTDKHWYECSRCHLKNHWHECSVCHTKKDEAAHDYGDDDICDICTYDNSVPHTHNLTLVDENPATCTTPGNKAYYTCDGCDKWFEDATGSVEITDKTSVILTANGHTPSGWKSDADNHWKECTVVGCGVIIEDSKAAHTASEWITDTPATATTDGTKHKECTVCHRKLETGTIPATGSGEHTHSYGSEWKSDADKHWHECSCGAKAEEAAHTASEWITDTAATATTDGTKYKECTVCHRVLETGKIPATGSGEHTHSYSSDWKSDSINHWHECSCGVKDDVAAHSFKWVIDKEATATKKGSKHEECKFCGYQRPAVEIPATGSTTKPTDPTESNPNTGALDDVPQTGDNSNMILWIVLLLASGLGVTGTVVYSKRKKYAK